MCSMPAITSRKRRLSPRPALPGTVTIATNMAGRGTDIQLGGNADMRIAIELANVSDEGERVAAAAQPFAMKWRATRRW